MKLVPTILFLLLSFYSSAQKDRFTENVLTATFIEPGISFETALANKLTAKFRTGITAAFAANELGGTPNIGVFLRPFISASGRFYYDFAKREDREKLTARNSANYVALLGMYGFPSFTKSNNIYLASPGYTINTGIVWGLQRNYNNRFSLDLNIGFGYLASKDNNTAGIISELTLGIWLGKRTD